MKTIVCPSQVITWAIAARCTGSRAKRPSLLRKDRDSLHFLGTGADSVATESGATRAKEL